MSDIGRAFEEVRARSERLCAPLTAEDCNIQSMPDVSPPKWHLAHTTWFFETFVLTPFAEGYRPFDSRYAHLFNSYYQTVGSMHPRESRGILSRPSLDDILAYRARVTGEVARLLRANGPPSAPFREIVRLGIAHEEQHQELILMDVKHIFASSPLKPVYGEGAPGPKARGAAGWVVNQGGLVGIGHASSEFAFDNETPRHDFYLRPFRISSREVTNGEYRAFIDEGGYRRPELWLSDGWLAVQRNRWAAPLYWEEGDRASTLSGVKPLVMEEPVCHVSYYEADAFARWAGKRLPTEQEWETASSAFEHGEVWEWTGSPYVAYPGYRPAAGALGEYNGKFMCNQLVLRGGSCVTPPSHARPTYRNFFPPESRWQFSGIRLAEDLR